LQFRSREEGAANPHYYFCPPQQATSCADVRAQITRGAVSGLWFTPSSHNHSIYLAPPGQRKVSCPSPASPPSFWVTANSPLPCSIMHSRGHSWPREIPPAVASRCRCLGAESSAPLRITACCQTCYLLM